MGRQLRLALTIGLAAALANAVAHAFALGSHPVAYATLIAALVIRPDFTPWPLVFYPALTAVAALGLFFGLGISAAFSGAPEVFLFAIAAAGSLVIGLTFPAKLAPLGVLLPVLAVLPLLSAGPTLDSTARQLVGVVLGLVVGSLVQALLAPAGAGKVDGVIAEVKPEAPPDLPLAQRLGRGFRSPWFWRKLVLASLALAIGEGIGAVTPKYLYFGVVLLLDDSVGATAARVKDRLIGVSLGVLMPLLVFNSFGMSELAVGLVMGGTASLVNALGLSGYLRTALISSGVAFIGYGPLVAWYIPHRWIDYSLGSALALLAGLLIAPQWALRRYRVLAALPDPSTQQRQELSELTAAASSEARLLGERL
ncbi:FUSC family protein [Cyanobium sp. ATX 6F1]|nr:FUSC family protein [Cyanobium sp. ATX 6F1]